MNWLTIIQIATALLLLLQLVFYLAARHQNHVQPRRQLKSRIETRQAAGWDVFVMPGGNAYFAVFGRRKRPKLYLVK